MLVQLCAKTGFKIVQKRNAAFYKYKAKRLSRPSLCNIGQNFVFLSRAVNSGNIINVCQTIY